MKFVSSFEVIFTSSKAIALSLLLGSVAFQSVAEEKSSAPPIATQPSQNVSFSLDANGNITAKNNKGENIGQKCSVNLNSDDACSIFKPESQILINNFTELKVSNNNTNLSNSVIPLSKNNLATGAASTTSSNPQCYLVIINGRAYVLPSIEYCSTHQ